MVRATCLLAFLPPFSAWAAEPAAQAINVPVPVEGAANPLRIQQDALVRQLVSALPPSSALFFPQSGSSLGMNVVAKGNSFELGIVDTTRLFGFDFAPKAGAWNGADYVFVGSRLLFYSGSDGSTQELVRDSWASWTTSAAFVSPTTAVVTAINGSGSNPGGAWLLRLVDRAATPITGPGLPANDAFGYGDGASAAFPIFPPGGGPATTVLFGFPFNGAYRSTDGGNSMSPVAGIPSFTGVSAFAQSGTAVVAATTKGLYRTVDQGANFTKVTAGLPAGTNAFSDVARGPNGEELYAATDAPELGIFKSVDAGATWMPTGPGIDANAINSVGAAGAAVLAATSNGVFATFDDGATWAPVGGPSFASILTILPAGNTLFAGTFGNSSGVLRSDDFGATWFATGGTAVAYKIIRALWAAGSVLLAGGEGGFFRSIDGGATLTAPARTSVGLPATGSPYAFAGVGSTVFMGLNPGGVFKSTDVGATWTASNNGLPAGVVVDSLVASGTTLFLGSNGSVYRSTDGGATWSAVTPPNPVGPYAVTSLLVDGGTLYAGTFGLGTPETHGLFESMTAGATWARANGLPSNQPVYALASDGAHVYAGLGQGVYVSEGGGAFQALQKRDLANRPIFALATAPPAPAPSGRAALAGGPTGRLIVGTGTNGIAALDVPQRTRRLVPIVLDVDTGSAHYTTELALTNRGAKTATLSFLYTASIGTGSGSAGESLAPGQQLVVADAIAYLRGKGVPIPSGASAGGTLLVTFDGLDDVETVNVTARTTTATAAPQPVGAAGLAYAAIDPDAGGSTDALTLFGLRSNASDRTNLAVYNTSAQNVTLKVTLFNGDGSGASSVVEAAAVLPPWGWKQYNRLLEGPGYATGWATAERVSDAGSFGAYAVINDNGTSDGSFALPTSGRSLFGAYLNVPVLVETGAFVSELVLSNAGATAATFDLSYRESLSPGAGPGGSVAIVVPARTQVIYPGAIAELRRRGVAVGPAGGGYAGSLHVAAPDANVNDLFAGARTASPSPASGQFGLFTPAFYPGEEAGDAAYVYGLRADAQNRSNVAMINTGQTDAAGPVTLQVQVYDGEAGGSAAGSAETVTLAPGQWAQLSGVLGAKGVKNGWVKVARTAGTSPWIAYGVVNDGGGPGQRTGDGAYLPMTR